jgi:hypothetical protein
MAVALPYQLRQVVRCGTVTRSSRPGGTGIELWGFPSLEQASMRDRILAVVAPALVVTAVFMQPDPLAARAAAGPRTAERVAALALQRAATWKHSAPVIHCGPAPLVERPGAAAESARPHLAPLETAFLDAWRVKRSIASHATSTRP